jgi:hypothetical protein
MSSSFEGVISYINANGDELFFDHRSPYPIIEKSGWNAPPITHVFDEVPEVAGAFYKGIKTSSRLVNIKVRIKGRSPEELRSNRDTLLGHIHPSLGEGYFIVRYVDGTDRVLNCRYAGGISEVADNNMTLGGSGDDFYHEMALSFQANNNPWWLDYPPTVTEYGTTSGITFFPFFPLRVSPSSIFGRYTINNPGDVACWPIWDIYGPGSEITLVNETYSPAKRLELLTTYTLLNGESIHIDTSPFIKTIEDQAGTNIFPELENDAEMWALLPGDNDVYLQMASTSANSSLSLTMSPPHMGP